MYPSRAIRKLALGDTSIVPRLETPISALAVEVDNSVEVTLRDDPGLAQAASKSTMTTAINLIRSPYTTDDEAGPLHFAGSSRVAALARERCIHRRSGAAETYG